MENTQNVQNQVEGKEIAEVSDDELAKALALSGEMQAKENAGDPIKADYILLAKANCKALNPKVTDLYIDGLKMGDFYIQKDKKNLGSDLKVVPLAFVTVYKEMTDGTNNANFVGMWTKEQASQFPCVEGSYYDRQLPNGHVLKPTNWVIVEIIGHSEIENAVIAYKSTGSRIWKNWKEDAKARSQSSATLVYSLFSETQANDKNTWDDIGFKFDSNLLESDKKMALFCLNKSNSIRKAYADHVLIGEHDISKLSAPSATAQITDGSDIEDADLNDNTVDF